jgi:hypothetical protein
MITPAGTQVTLTANPHTNQSPGYTIAGEIRSNALGMESPYTSRRAARYRAVTFTGDQSS